MPATRGRASAGPQRCVYFVVDSSVPHLLRILIVDDNVDGADMLATMLSMWGYETAMEHSGPAALEQARTFRPHVILLDIALPGMDGYEVARQVRLLPGLEQVAVVALTGYAQDQDRHRAAGFAAHLVKPIDLDTLRRTLAALEPR